MKQVISLLLTLILAGPVSAGTIRITAEDAGSARLRIGYEATGGTELPVGFGLDITLSNGATFQSVVCASSYFPIYPGTIQIDASGNIMDEKTNPQTDQDSCRYRYSSYAPSLFLFLRLYGHTTYYVHRLLGKKRMVTIIPC